ncbi:helix-turn-helix domain-containing protein [Enterococcus faecalis]|uniref:helix-turn-helix domain-containing protein n=1 Tax=Enterococcus TaxID=1350 RepID=UPI001D0B5AE3|nr:helix-turn-helix transcriptional regulator [Enterococcus faecalis]MCB8473026.1 helix-turn-helix domain-containing protein [Enterococcus faecalis]MCB8519463.1 helix-turn-helix domain-containing protein [Enterococcus faecalis]
MLEIIKKLCKNSGISVYQLEEYLGFGRNTIYQWNKRTPGIDKIESVADYFQVSTDYLLGRTDTPDELSTRNFASSISDLIDSNDSDTFELINTISKLDKESLSAIKPLVDRILELEKRQPFS